MGASVIPLGYQPRAAFAPFHSRRQRWSSLVCHRRAGKTVACVADLVDAALRLKKPNPRFAYIARYFSQAKDVAWVYLKDMTRAIPGVEINESELRVDLPHLPVGVLCSPTLCPSLRRLDAIPALGLVGEVV